MVFFRFFAFWNFCQIKFWGRYHKKIILKDDWLLTYGMGVNEFWVNFVVGNSIKIQNQCFWELGFHAKVYILLKYEHNGHGPHQYILIFVFEI